MMKRAGWVLLAAFVVTLGTAIYIGFNPAAGDSISVLDAVWATSFVGFPIAGALVIDRYPRRPLGWMLCLAPLLLIFGVACSEVAKIGIGDPDSPAVWFSWLGSVTFTAGMGLLLMTPLFLPDGLLLSRRWRAAVWPLVLFIATAVVASAFGPWEVEGGGSNPIGIAALGGLYDLTEAMLGVTTFWALGFGVLSLVLRFRRSRGIERQQLKMLALGALGIVASFGSLAATEAILGEQSNAVATLFAIFAILSLPTSIAMAVMRHRLYDVDVIINRTLVYAGLTAILALCYLGVVVVLQRLLAPITADSDVAIAGSTLAVAALFRPLRARVQAFIDRRFYRGKYDAAEALDAFSAHLRDEVDLESLRSQLVGVVAETMQPAHASVWLRTETER